MIGRTAGSLIVVGLFAAAAGPTPGGHEDSTFAGFTARVHWQRGQPGVEWATLPFAGQGDAYPLTLVLARLDPHLLSFDLVWDIERDRPSWAVERAGDAALALNAGMFVQRLPWGWVVMDGHERLPPGQGPLSSALIGFADGRLVWVDGDDVAKWRGQARENVRFAFQSYPTLLVGDGAVPAALHDGTINGTHRDARLAIGLDRQGHLLVAMTRLDVPIPGADRLPFGLTVPEMAALMGALGARQAMLLDGGISAQLTISDSSGQVRAWKGLRKVPLGLVAR